MAYNYNLGQQYNMLQEPEDTIGQDIAKLAVGSAFQGLGAGLNAGIQQEMRYQPQVQPAAPSTGQNAAVGGASGALSGAATGAGFGTAFGGPLLGTAVGALVGGLGGALMPLFFEEDQQQEPPQLSPMLAFRAQQQPLPMPAQPMYPPQDQFAQMYGVSNPYGYRV